MPLNVSTEILYGKLGKNYVSDKKNYDWLDCELQYQSLIPYHVFVFADLESEPEKAVKSGGDGVQREEHDKLKYGHPNTK